MEVQRINFTSKKQSNGMGVNPKDLSDEDIVKVAAKKARREIAKTPQARILNALPVVAIASVAALNGASRPGKLSSKLSASIQTLGAFAIVSGVFDGVKKCFNKIEDKSESAKKTNREHPIATGLTKVAASMFLAGIAVKGVGKVSGKLAKMFPEVTKEMSKMSLYTRKIVDDSKLGKMAENMSKRYSDFKVKHKTLTEFASKNAFPLTVLSYFATSMGLSASLEGKKYDIANKTAQEMYASKYSLNTTSVW